jgi:hypothetical protein
VQRYSFFLNFPRLLAIKRHGGLEEKKRVGAECEKKQPVYEKI